jgi:hypothetical protein
VREDLNSYRVRVFLYNTYDPFLRFRPSVHMFALNFLLESIMYEGRQIKVKIEVEVKV